MDDGAPDLETALAMARFGQKNGLSTIAATPHFNFITAWSSVKLQVAKLRRALAEEGIEVEVVPGAELYIDLELAAMEAREIPTYGDRGGQYCLIEFPMYQIPIYTEQVLFALQTKGIVPIIAHPRTLWCGCGKSQPCFGVAQGGLSDSGQQRQRFGGALWPSNTGNKRDHAYT